MTLVKGGTPLHSLQSRGRNERDPSILGSCNDRHINDDGTKNSLTVAVPLDALRYKVDSHSSAPPTFKPKCNAADGRNRYDGRTSLDDLFHYFYLFWYLLLQSYP